VKSTAYEKPTTVAELSELYDPQGFRKEDPGEAAEEKIKSPGAITADWHKVYKDAGLDVGEDQEAVKGHLLRGLRQMRGGLDLVAQGLQTVEMAVACTPAEELTDVLKELFPQKQPEPAKESSTPGQIISQVSSLVREVVDPQQQTAAAETPAAPAFMRTRKTTKRVQAGELSITHIPKTSMEALPDTTGSTGKWSCPYLCTSAAYGPKPQGHLEVVRGHIREFHDGFTLMCGKAACISKAKGGVPYYGSNSDSFIKHSKRCGSTEVLLVEACPPQASSDEKKAWAKQQQELAEATPAEVVDPAAAEVLAGLASGKLEAAEGTL